jgi:hypothetical protein
LILLSQLLFNTALEHFFFSLWPCGSSSPDEINVTFEALLVVSPVAVSASQFDLHSIADLSLLSIDALDDLLSSDSLRVESDDALLTQLLQLGPSYSRLLEHVRFELLSWEGVSPFVNCLTYFSLTASIWDGVAALLQPPPRPPLDSRIVSSFPPLFEEFRGKRFALLWRGSRDGFGAGDFHRRRDVRANTLTPILDTGGNVFGGFTPLEWESREDRKSKSDGSLKSFLFTLKNPHNTPARKFALMAENKQPIHYDASCGPIFGNYPCDIYVSGNCNAKTYSYTFFGIAYNNDTGLNEDTFFAGSYNFKVREIEVFKITN